MPGMNGVKGVRSLRMRRPDVPVAVISALADDFVMRECFDAGAIGYIPKFLSRTEIATAISTILDGGSYTPAERLETGGPPRDFDDDVVDETIRSRFELPTNPQRTVTALMPDWLPTPQTTPSLHNNT